MPVHLVDFVFAPVHVPNLAVVVSAQGPGEFAAAIGGSAQRNR